VESKVWDNGKINHKIGESQTIKKNLGKKKTDMAGTMDS
jgi:hypothetical protein